MKRVEHSHTSAHGLMLLPKTQKASSRRGFLQAIVENKTHWLVGRRVMSNNALSAACTTECAMKRHDVRRLKR